jgi:hypothetical protein
VNSQLADELERFIERDAIWDVAELARYARRLGAASETGAVVDLAHAFAALRLRLQMCEMNPRLRRDVEGVFYPRLWKVIEAVRDELPESEQLVRMQVLNRRLARLFVEEDPHG